MKKLFAVWTAAALLLFSGCGTDKDTVRVDMEPHIVINGTAIQTSAAVIDNSLYIPVREVFGGLGYQINFDTEEKSVEVVDTNSGAVISPKIKFDKEKIIYFNSMHDDQLLSGHLQMIDDAVYVPLFMLTGDMTAELGDAPQEPQEEKKTFLFFKKDEESGSDLDYTLDTLADSLRQDFGMEIKWDSSSGKIYIDTDSGSYNSNSQAVVTNDGDDFAFELNDLMPDDKNYAFSPVGLKYALAMAANSCDTDTRAEITSKLGISDLEIFNDSVPAYMEKYNRQNGLTIRLANSIWLNDDTLPGAEFAPDFKDIAENKYMAAVQNVDNTNCIDTINKWCMDNSDYAIYDIARDSDFLTCLASTLYFKGNWKNGFMWEDTKYDVFNDRKGEGNYVGYMSQVNNFRYAGDEDVQMLAMPLQDESLYMYFVMSNDKPFDFAKYLDKLETRQVKVEIPKFTVQYSEDMTKMFEKTGLERSFGKNSNFANMLVDGDKGLNAYITKAMHKTYLAIDENGLYDNAASNSSGENKKDTPKNAVVFRADKPFTYIVRDDSNGEILLMGEYAFAE